MSHDTTLPNVAKPNVANRIRASCPIGSITVGVGRTRDRIDANGDGVKGTALQALDPAAERAIPKQHKHQ